MPHHYECLKSPRIVLEMIHRQYVKGLSDAIRNGDETTNCTANECLKLIEYIAKELGYNLS